MGEQVFRINRKRYLFEIFGKLLDAILLSLATIVFLRSNETLGVWLAAIVIVLILVLLALTIRQVLQMVNERIILNEDSVRMLYKKRVLFEARYEDIVYLDASRFNFGNDVGIWMAHTSDQKILMFKGNYANWERLVIELEERTGLKFKVDLVQSPSRSVKA